jgi:hypothetical protein
VAEVESAAHVLVTPAARLIARGEERLLFLEEVEALLASGALIADGCRHVVRDARTVVSLGKRPVLFALARTLAEAWPADVPRSTLIARAFRLKLSDESHRARLRVELGRLRLLLRALAEVRATERGFALAPRRAREVVVLARPVEAGDALALGASQRTVQRALDSLASAGKVQSLGHGRARRWMTRRWGDSRRRCYSRLRCRAVRMTDTRGAVRSEHGPRSSASTGPFPVSTAFTACRTTVGRCGLLPETS